MFKKSTPGSIVMSSLAVLSAFLTVICWELPRNPNIIKQITGSQSTYPGGFIFSSLAALAVLFFLFVIPGAVIIRNRNNSYFGKDGAIRWILFGIASGSLAQVQFLLPKPIIKEIYSSFFLEIITGISLGYIVFYTAHFLAFRLFRLPGGRSK